MHCNGENTEDERTEPRQIEELREAFAYPVGQTSGQTHPLVKIVEGPEKQLVLLLIKEMVGIEKLEKHEAQHRPEGNDSKNIIS